MGEGKALLECVDQNRLEMIRTDHKMRTLGYNLGMRQSRILTVCGHGFPNTTKLTNNCS